jgi:asparagine synthase (glutamine-hydrolysing)
VISPFQSHSVEFLERFAARFGTSVTFPYYDIRLIKFFLALPPDQKLRNGYNRAVVREALKGIMPEPVRTRKSKTNFIKNAYDAYFIRSREWFEESFYSAPESVFSYVDRKSIKASFNNCITQKSRQTLLADLCKMFRFISLANWLQKIENP